MSESAGARSDLEPFFLRDFLIRLVETEFGSGTQAIAWLSHSLRSNDYNEEAVTSLVSASKGLDGESWPERRFAILLLENQLLRLSGDDLTAFDGILVALDLKPRPGSESTITASVLREGFTTSDPRGFIAELLRKLARLDRVHAIIRNGGPDESSWTYVLHTAREASKLTLGRYLFTPQEVLDEIHAGLRLTRATETQWAPDMPPIPEFETRIVEGLCTSGCVYWGSEKCGSGLNALVEYPLTSAVVVIKPPGSDLEIEIKRAGLRGPRALDVIRTKNGREAPVSHRLFGGSLGWLAQRETAAAAVFADIYRRVHGSEGPCSRGVVNYSVVGVPTKEGEAHILDYLSDAQIFGAGFDETRRSMEMCFETFPSDTGVARASYSGDLGLTLGFIGQALPQQAIIVGSSSLRLDRVAIYLSESGPQEYFTNGLGRDCTMAEMRWLADTVLEEILGEVEPPAAPFVDYAQYLYEAFRVPANRRRADENYLSVMAQIGECWGTLLAVRGFSDGESFVLRNVGLKSVWQDGRWQIRIIFMDHDDLTVAGSRYRYLWPWREASGMERDEVHILGGPMGEDRIPGEAGALRTIYRVSPDVGNAGLEGLKAAMIAAYDRTQSKLGSDTELQAIFYPRFIEGYRDFDRLVPWFLGTDPSEAESWKVEAAAVLKAQGYEDDLAAEYTRTVVHFRPLFERLSFLYAR